MKKLIGFSALLFAVLLTGCNKAPGEGGTSSITGKLKIVDLNSSGDTVATYYAMDEDVYIIYGEDNNTYNDKFSTSFDGSYRFDHLTNGKYTIFAYSDCDVCESNKDARKVEIEITDKKQVLTATELIIIK